MQKPEKEVRNVSSRPIFPKTLHKFKGKLLKKKPPKPNEDEVIESLKERYASIEPKEIKAFADLPLSWKTQKGLKVCNYKLPTDIQKESIGFALQGRDVLGAAITGSGKTLAFLVPVLENLFLKKWTRMDGIGAIIISPTRELAYQIFETLRKVGSFHEFSAGLIIGGKNLKFERSRMDQCNIIICTPGRILQHMDENPLFNASTMSILVLDEADRCLDMGFEQSMNAIIENLPPERQTLLFSATQTSSVKDLARLSLVNPVHVAPHEQQQTTPDALKQSYVVIDLEKKITMIWSFIKNHLKQKVIVFMSSCKQVKYVYEIFCKLRPGTSLLALYGTLHQDRRVQIYNEFCRKSNVILFATDVASRGLDFPVVNWVVQLDCPEDVTQYIHRAGRTARHNAHGESLLVLLPSEELAMVDELKARKIPINKIDIDPRKLFSPNAKMEAYLAQNQELKNSAQRAFVAYIKSVVLMKNKKIFNAEKLDTDSFARSLGLVAAPRIRFLERMKKRKMIQKKGHKPDEVSDGHEGSDEDETFSCNEDKDQKPIFGGGMNQSDTESDISENLFKLIRRDHGIEEALSSVDENLPSTGDVKQTKQKTLTKAALAKRVIKKKIITNKKVVFDEDGEKIQNPARHLQSELAKEYENQEVGGLDIEKAMKVLREEDKFDKQRFKDLVKTKRQEKKKKVKQNKMAQKQLDDFGSEDEESSVDLSWLPDPEKIYGGKKTKGNESDQSDNESEIHQLPRKLYENKSRKRMREIAPASSDEEDEEEREEQQLQTGQKKAKGITDKLTVDEAELLAIQLLEAN